MNDAIRIPGPEWETSTLEQVRLPLDIALHVVLLLMALSPFMVLFLKRRSSVGWLDFWLLMATTVAVPFGIGWLTSVLPTHLYLFVIGYGALSMLVLFVSLFIVARRMKQPSQASYATSILMALLAVGVLIGLLLPAVPSAREASRRMACSNLIRQVGLAVLENFRSQGRADHVPSENSPTLDGGPEISWRVHLLPYLELAPLRDRYTDAATWDSPQNLPIAATKIHAYTCPSEPNLVSPTGGRFTSYAKLATTTHSSANAMIEARSDSTNRLPETNTPEPTTAIEPRHQCILLLESCSANIVWSEPRDIDLDTMEWSIQSFDARRGTKPWQSKSIGSSWHGSGTHAIFSDGSIRYLPASIDKRILEALVRGEPWNENDFE